MSEETDGGRRAVKPMWQRWLWGFASVGGYVFFLGIVLWLAAAGRFVPGGGDVRDVFRPAGDAFLAGRPVYNFTYPPYFYSPPITLLFAALSPVPVTGQWLLVNLLNFAALRYVARSWRRVGYLLWIPTIPFEIALANVNLIVAAAVVAAVREGRTALPAALTFVKLSPVLAVDPRKWRPFLLWTALGIAVTLPWWWLWPQWIEQLVRNWNAPVGNLIPIPLLVRAPIGLALVATRTRLGRVTGAVIAIPAFYWLSLVTLVAPLAVGWEVLSDWHERRAAGPPMSPEPAGQAGPD